jgi:hypothetical protein
MTTDSSSQSAWEWLSESDDLKRDMLIVFDEQKLARLSELLGPKSELAAIKSGLLMTAQHYLGARALASRRKPGAAEWKRMVRFGELAKSYAKALDGLMANGNADQRLVLDLLNPPEGRVELGEILFHRMFEEGGPRSPLRQLQRLVEATARAADRLTVEPFDDETEDVSAAYQEMIAIFATPQDKRHVELFCLKEGLTAFQRVWLENSDKPFNAGKYYSDVGGFVGDAISAAHLVMNTLDPVFTERRIATVIREINKTPNGYKNAGGKP